MPTDDKAERLKRKLEQYRGFVFRWQAYKELAPDWDHDHCNGCWARLPSGRRSGETLFTQKAG